VLTMRLLFLDTFGSPHKRPRPSRAVYELPIQPAITTVSAQDAGQRQLCVSYICQQQAYRLRHREPLRLTSRRCGLNCSAVGSSPSTPCTNAHPAKCALLEHSAAENAIPSAVRLASAAIARTVTQSSC